MRKIAQIVVAFSEKLNFKNIQIKAKIALKNNYTDHKNGIDCL